MIDAAKSTQEVLMHVKYPRMVDESFELETGPGWSRIIDQTTAEIYATVTERRLRRANAIRYNRALARGLSGDVAGLEHFFLRYYFGPRALASEHLINRKVTESLIDAEYEIVPEAYVYPRVLQIKEKFGDLRYYADFLHDDLMPVINLAERLCRFTCETCGTPGLKRDNIGWIRVLCDHHHEIAEINRRRNKEQEVQAYQESV